MKTILHVDMNSYFATAEQQANPYIRGKPVGVVKALGRGCIIAASVEAKKFGVKTGTTVWEAKKKCPQIILVPADMDKYFSLTERLIKIVSDYSFKTEIFSIDEVFIDITETQKTFSGQALEIALEIKQRVALELGEWMRVSVGISFTKLLAKLASELQKPDGLVWLTKENYLEKTEKVSVDEVCGIGYSRSKYLKSRGAFSLGQARLLEDLPKDIYDLVWLLLDEELNLVEELDPAKSVSRTFTTFKVVDNKDEILALVRNLTEEATAKLREMQMVGRTFSLSLSAQNGIESFWARKTVNSSTSDPLIIFNLLEQAYLKSPLVGIRQAGVWISNLQFDVQTSLFERRTNLLKTTDDVNEKFGLFTIYPATLLGKTLIRPEVTGYLGDKYYRFGIIDA